MKKPTEAKWRVLLVTALTSSLFLVDSMILPVALPKIQVELGFSQIGIMWVINAYLLALTSCLLIGGKLVEFYGIRRLCSCGLALFGAGAFVGGFSYSAVTLLISRMIMGIGSSCAFPATASLLIRSFPENMRARALGIDTGIATLVMMLSPALGGFLTQFYTWRWIFFLYLPFVLLGIYFCHKIVGKERKRITPFPFVDSTLMVIGAVSLVTGLMEGNVWGWVSYRVTIFLLSGVAFLFLFVKRSLQSAYPLADFTLFKNPLFFGANASRFVAYVLMAATVLWIVYFETVLDYTPFQIGMFIFLGTLPVIGMSPIGGYLADRYWFRGPLSLGYSLLLFSFSWMMYFYNSTTAWGYFPGLMAFAVGVAMIMSPTLALGLSTIRFHSLGSASAMMMAVRQLASTLGIAFMTATYYSTSSAYNSPSAGMFSICFLAFLLTMWGFLVILTTVKQKFHTRLAAG
jgi:EmrB/QacA subfamily drug resistance transporter